MSVYLRKKMHGAVLMAFALLCLPTCRTIAQSPREQLQAEFASPPDSAKPRVWWHWMNGNITTEGIKLDLEWMRRVGIGGLQMFDASIKTPQVVERPLDFMTPPWKEAFRYAATLSDRLGLELAIAGSPGFSESGGPWVKPEEGMKKLVWTETRVSGGTAFSGKLPQPSSTVGPFQSVPVERGYGSFAGPPPAEPVPGLYWDVAVVAHRLPDEDKSMAEMQPVVTSSAGVVDGSVLWGGDFTHIIQLPFGQRGQPAWILVDFGHPQVVQSISVGLQVSWNPFAPRQVSAEFESSADGVKFHHIGGAYDTADSPSGIPPSQETVTFAPVVARYFRLLLPTPPTGQMSAAAAAWRTPATEHRVTEFMLYSTPRVDHFEKKAAYFLDAGADRPSARHLTAHEIVNPSDVIDLSAQMRPDGTLNWTPPEGRWEVLRVGYSLIGTTNSPASPHGTGLEVDKLSRRAVKAHMDNYLDRYESILGPQLFGGHGLHGMVNDSYEAGPQNWTDDLPMEFSRRRGYDLHLWLPALTGRIVGSAEATDRFLWDFRRTLGELLTENHYGEIAASLHARGMIHYGEAHEAGRAFIGDGMDAKRDDDVPMGTMWMPGFFVSQEQCDADIRESASVAHLYGQNLVAAESMTAFGMPGVAYAFAPETLKPTADRELADGVNLFIVHTSVHQPQVGHPPGVTLGSFGQWFTRHETWAEQAAPWVTYLSRSAYLLQQGHFSADIVYYYGQDSNITALYGKHAPAIPEGYAFDFASAHALSLLSVQNGYLVTASGMRYRILVLDPRARVMSMDVLKRIAQLAEAGATIVGEKPQISPSVPDSPKEFAALADALWGVSGGGKHRYANGVVISGTGVSDVMSDIKLEPDFSYSKPEFDTTVWFVHRRLKDKDLYFINNRQGRPEQIEARFRVRDKVPELWHADTGAIEPVSYRQEDNCTIIPLRLDPHDAVFVLFDKPSQERERRIAQFVPVVLGSVTGPWHIQFQPGRGAPDQATFTELKSWTTSSDPGIKYFSGSASYDMSLSAPKAWFKKGQRVEIDLGTVKNIAEVLVDGRSAGVAWKSPYRVDLTDFVKPGLNRMTIRVINLWPNRLIGDKQPNALPIAFTTFNPYNANSPLLDSGLLGPIRVLGVKTRTVP